MHKVTLFAMMLGLAACSHGASHEMQCSGTAAGCAPGPGVDGGVHGSPDGGACDAPRVVCPKGCFDIASDPANCGSCGYACPDDGTGTEATCVAGQCGLGCAAAGETLCDTTCRDLLTDANACGSCDHGCLDGHVVPPDCQRVSGVCAGGTCGFEPDPSLDDATCSLPANAVGKCLSGACRVWLGYCGVAAGVFYAHIAASNTDPPATACACAGNTLTYGTGQLSCGACLSEGSSADCLQ